MTWRELNDMLDEHREVQNRLDEQTHELVKLILGRLRNINSYWGKEDLAKLKKELSRFNAKTGKWKD